MVFLMETSGEKVRVRMQIVINLSDSVYNAIKNKYISLVNPKEGTLIKTLWDAVENGTPLPKGHGDLKDISNIDNDKIEKDNPVIYLTVNGEYIEAVSLDYLNGLPIIIEADKEKE